jgi:hypothetical protein
VTWREKYLDDHDEMNRMSGSGCSVLLGTPASYADICLEGLRYSKEFNQDEGKNRVLFCPVKKYGEM